MALATAKIEDRIALDAEIRRVIQHLGSGKVSGVAYDTAWVARLSSRYPGYGFEQSLAWLREHQLPDGSWGSQILHYHDRYISTLAAITTLKEAGGDPDDQARIARGEQVLWRLVGHLGKDNSDTIGFPVLSSALAEEAAALGLEVPRPSARYAAAFRDKVALFLNQTNRNWRQNTLSFSMEAMRSIVQQGDDVLEDNHSINVSPSATAGYLMEHRNEHALGYLQSVMTDDVTGSAPAVAPIDVFEATWSLNHLRLAGAVHPDMPGVRKVLDRLWQVWSPDRGVSYSSYFGVSNLDDTASCFAVLHWGGYPVDVRVFERFERDDHFYCFPNETDISLGAHVRLLTALKQWGGMDENHPWIVKIMSVFRRTNKTGTFWWDKWHVSPYYLSSTAVMAMHGIATELAHSRLTWIMKTQNQDGGWGYLDHSTAEESAYCLEALLYWDRAVERVDPAILGRACAFLSGHVSDTQFPSLWIGKSLYTPYYPVKSAVLGAVMSCMDQRSK